MKNKILKLVIIAKFINDRYVNSGSQYITLLIVTLHKCTYCFVNNLFGSWKYGRSRCKKNIYTKTTRIKTRT